MIIADYKRLYNYSAEGELRKYLRVTYDSGFTGLYVKDSKINSLNDYEKLCLSVAGKKADWQDSWTQDEKQDYLFRTCGKNNCVVLCDESCLMPAPAYLMVRECYGEPVEFYRQCRTLAAYETANELGMVIPDDLPNYEGNILKLRECMKHKWKDDEKFSEVCARMADFMEVLHTQEDELPAVLETVAGQRHLNLKPEWSIMQKKFKLLDALQY